MLTMLGTMLAEAGPIEHVLPHTLFKIGPVVVNNQMFMALVAAVLMLLIFPRLFKKPVIDAPKGATNFFESILEFLRVEVIRPALKENTDRFVPYLWTVFFFILFCNLLGSIPLAEIFALISGGKVEHLGGTATGNINSTGALAICTFFFIHFSGIWQVARSLMDGTYGHHPHHEEHTSSGEPGHEAAQDLEHDRAEGLPADVPANFQALPDPTHHYRNGDHVGSPEHGVPAPGKPAHGVAKMSAGAAVLKAVPLYFWNFAPHPFKPQPGASKVGWAADIPVWAMLLVLELIGAIIKPVALCIRLFANMIAGHLVLGALVLLIVSTPNILAQIGIGVPVTALSLLIRMLELFVAFLQAYIFTFLATLFLASAVAPEH